MSPAAPRVLIVDDNEMNVVLAATVLAHDGFVVESAEDAPSALQRLPSFQPTLILMDIQMPGMDGVEATHRIRALKGPTGEVPILAMTANAMAHQQAAYLAAGMDGAIAKPLSPAALTQAIAQALTADRPGTRKAS